MVDWVSTQTVSSKSAGCYLLLSTQDSVGAIFDIALSCLHCVWLSAISCAWKHTDYLAIVHALAHICVHAHVYAKLFIRVIRNFSITDTI